MLSTVSRKPELRQYKLCLEEFHYENLPMKYTDFFSVKEKENFIRKILIFFLYLLKTEIVGRRYFLNRAV